MKVSLKNFPVIPERNNVLDALTEYALETKKWREAFKKELREKLSAENQNYDTASNTDDKISNIMGTAHAHGRRQLIKEILGEA